jgi:hypothetical protein
VDRTSTAKYQHTRFPHFTDYLPECNMICRVKALMDRELDDGDPAFRVHKSQRYPCTMVQSPCRINITRETGFFKMIYYLCGEIGTPRRRILYAVQFPGKTIKIMDCLMRFSGVNTGPVGIPVC